MTRKEAIEKVKDMMDYIIRFHAPNDVFVDHMNEAIEALKEPKQGEWIIHADDLYPAESTQECSVCHAEQYINGNDDDYCPKCGADMRVKDELNRVSKELNSEIEKSKGKILPDYCDGLLYSITKEADNDGT